MHIPVLLHEVISLLDLHPEDCVLDGTVNGAGHARAIIPFLTKGHYIACDADTEALSRAKKALEEFDGKLTFVHANFRDLSETIKTLAHTPNKFLFDLGWSMNQFDDPKRGFSFAHKGPLDMRYDPSTQLLTAEDIVNTWPYADLMHMLKGYGEESFAPLIAKAIEAERKVNRIHTTEDLAELISRSVPAFYRNGKVHPATKTFQSLRIAVNDEFGVIETGIKAALEAMPVGGRVAVITFHSLEDRIVKYMFREAVATEQFALINKKAVQAEREEVLANKRSRSAKLRVITKIS